MWKAPQNMFYHIDEISTPWFKLIDEVGATADSNNSHV